ncbi:BPSS1780 family membrane protein [Thiomonas sp.]|jgi:hypothetical protein|uniref:BPSS1780 family membrane protein n=1 Tax=Thiomonas sp. TaxID=2047785 RepID=UPI00260C6F48|nr:BPSS1780 family membrane protein [Thiomonas sp.]
MQLRTVPAREGLLWVQSGFRRLARQPWAALLMILAYVVVTGLVSALPVIGLVFPLFAVQFGTIGFMQASRQIALNQAVWPTVLLTGLRAGPSVLRNLLLLGALYTVAVLLVLGLGALFDGGAMLRLLLLGDKPPASAVTGGGLRLGAIVATLAYIPVSLAFWLAPPLITWHGMPAFKALFFSFVLCLRNLKAFAVYALQWLVLFLSVPTLIVLVASLLGAGDTLAAALSMPVIIALFLAYILSFYGTYESLVADTAA